MSQPATEMNFGGRFHQDDRGIRYCDVFPEIGKGDINISIMEPGAAALWHRHHLQDDYQIVVKGALKVGICNAPYMGGDDLGSFQLPEEDATRIYQDREDLLEEWKKLREEYGANDPYYKQWPEDEGRISWHYLSERNACQGPISIPRGMWHGSINYTNEPAILIYHITNKYDGEDEDRLHPLVAGWNYEREVK